MARGITKGLEYLPLDLDWYQDRKIMKLRRRCGLEAPGVYVILLCMIYRDGYYVKWDDDFAFDVAEVVHGEEEKIREILQVSLEVGLFNKKLFDEHHVLTSAGIQRRYNSVCEKAKRKNRVCEFDLLGETGNKSENIPIPSEITPINSEEMPITSEVMQQRKEKKRKGINKENILKEKILSEFFRRNISHPVSELEKMIAYNSGPAAKTKWDAMTDEEKLAVAKMWKQQPAQPPRFDSQNLDFWVNIYQQLSQLNAPDDVCMSVLAGKVLTTARYKKLTLYVDKCLMVFMEEHMDFFRPILQNEMSARGCSSVTYQYA